MNKMGSKFKIFSSEQGTDGSRLYSQLLGRLKLGGSWFKDILGK
jgi:hypothetical protein